MKSFVKKLSIFLVVVSFGLNLLWSNEKSLQINPDIKIGTLENGMSYYVMKNSEPKNRIFFRLVVKAGSNLEEDDYVSDINYNPYSRILYLWKIPGQILWCRSKKGCPSHING